MRYLSFSNLLISLTIILSSSIHAVTKVGCASVLQSVSIPLCKCATAFLSTHLLMETGCFQILAIVNNSVMNIGVHIFFQINVLGFFGYIPKSGIAGSKGRDPFLIF